MPKRIVYFFVPLVSILLLTLNSTAQQTGEILVNPTTIDTFPVIKGKVKDEKGDPIGFASVIVQGTGQGTIVDKDGNFSLKRPPNSQFITVSCIGFQMQTVPLKESSENIQIVLKPLVLDTTIGVVFVSKKSKKKKDPTIEERPNNIKIFPNPSPQYSILNIEWEFPTDDDHMVEIFEIRGNMVQKHFIDLTKKTSRVSMQLSLKTSGDYLLRITNKRTHKVFQTQLMAI